MQTTRADLILWGGWGRKTETPLVRLVFFVQTKQSQAYDINMLRSPTSIEIFEVAGRFSSPTNGTSLESTPSRCIQISRKLPINGTPLEEAPSRNIQFSH